jgi:enoyl-CoA hydratase
VTDVLLIDTADRVATVTLNRPEARNALDRDLRRELTRAMRALDEDDAVDVVVLTGADPAFCAGLDLKELGRGGNDLRGRAVPDGSDRAQTQRGPFPPMAKPVIGAINGAAVTGGFELALQCDFLVASERARFADTHARVGIMPGWGLTVLLPQAVGLRRARHMSLTGNYVDAATALAWGLVNVVVPHDELLSVCRALAGDIVSNDQRAVRRVNQTYDEGALLAGSDAWELEGEVAGAWTAGFDPADIEARRTAVMARGRGQLGSE